MLVVSFRIGSGGIGVFVMIGNELIAGTLLGFVGKFIRVPFASSLDIALEMSEAVRVSISIESNLTEPKEPLVLLIINGIGSGKPGWSAFSTVISYFFKAGSLR